MANGLSFVNGRWRESQARNLNYCKLPIRFTVGKEEMSPIEPKFLWDTDDLVDIHCATDRKFSLSGMWNIWTNWSKCRRGDISIRVRNCIGEHYERCGAKGYKNQIQVSECPFTTTDNKIHRERCSRRQAVTKHINSIQQRHAEERDKSHADVFWTLKAENETIKQIMKPEGLMTNLR